MSDTSKKSDEENRDTVLKRMLNTSPKPHTESPPAPNKLVGQALDALALALVDHDHEWTKKERSLYETAISLSGCKDADS